MKMNTTYIWILMLCLSIPVSHAQVDDSPYHTEFWKDGAWLTAGIGLNVYGLILIQNKEDLTIAELNQKSEDDVLGIDRWAAGNFSESASTISDIPFYTSFATPFLLILDKKTRAHTGQLSVMFLESMSTAGALFTISAGLVNRSRPKVYNTNVELEERLRGDNQRSFFSGHVAASAAATFFAAQVFADFFPNSKAKPWVWAGAAAIPAAVGYFRIESGNHFLTDVVLGYAVGAASGMLIPRLHRKKNNKLKISPSVGYNSQMLHVSYTF